MQVRRTDKIEVSILKKSIVKIEVFDGVDLNEEDARGMTKIVREMMGENTKYTVLLDGTKPFNISDEARKWIASKHNTTNRIAAAFVITSLANRLLGNFFIRFNKPHSPTKIFNSEEEAVKWLEGIIKKEKI